MIHVSKGSSERRTNVIKFNQNWEKIFGKTTEKERPRELIRHQYTESYRTSEWSGPYIQKGGVLDSEYSIQYNTPTENN